MKKTIKILAIIVIIAMLMPFTIVNAETSKTEKIVETLEKLAKSFDGTVKYEDDTIEIEWNTPNSKSTEIVFSYNGNVIEYNSGKITSYEEAVDVPNHVIYAIYLIESALKLNGYSKEEIRTALNSENSNLSYEINGIEIEQTGEAVKFTSEDGSFTTTVSPMSIKIDVSKANLNKSSEEPLPTNSTTVSDVVENLAADSDFTTTEYEGKVVYENEIYNDDDDTITIVHTYHWEDYHSAYFHCEDDVIFYEDETMEDYYDAERSLSEAMYADIILSTALKMNGYTVEEIQEFLSKNEFDYEINGIVYKEIGEEKTFTSSDGSSTVTASPISFKIDLEKANLNEVNEEKVGQKDYTVNSNTNSGDSILFTALEGGTYSFSIIDRLATTDEDLQKMVDLPDDSEYTFEALKEQLNKIIGYGKKAAGDNGTLLKLYEVYLTNNGTEVHEVDGGFKIKLKITDNMNGYDTYQLIYIAEDGTAEKAIELTKNGEYLEGTLPHLSMYALVGNKKETETEATDTNATSENTNTTGITTSNINAEAKTNNPQTGDNIIFFIGLFVIATLGTYVIIKHNKISK